MKKLIIMALLAVAIFPACKKDKDNGPAVCKPATDLIRGTWTVTNAKSEYFNTMNNADTKVTDAVVEQTPSRKYVITADRIREVDINSGDIKFDNPYTLGRSNSGRNTITFKGEGDVEQQTYEIVTLNNDTLELQQVRNNQTYKTVTGGTKTAARQVITLDFKRSDTTT